MDEQQKGKNFQTFNTTKIDNIPFITTLFFGWESNKASNISNQSKILMDEDWAEQTRGVKVNH